MVTADTGQYKIKDEQDLAVIIDLSVINTNSDSRC
jgi:hypothetical protein